MTQEFFLPAQIIHCPTVRDEAGRAMSSRNELLPPAPQGTAASLLRRYQPPLAAPRRDRFWRAGLRIYGIPDSSGSRQQKEGPWAAFSTTLTAEAIGFDVSVCARLPCWQLYGPRLLSTQRSPQSTTFVRRSRRTTASLRMSSMTSCKRETAFSSWERRTACFASMGTALPR